MDRCRVASEFGHLLCLSRLLDVALEEYFAAGIEPPIGIDIGAKIADLRALVGRAQSIATGRIKLEA